MTLVTCFRGRDGVVLAADSRGTIGDPRALTAINDTQQKLFQLSKFTGIVSFGQAELAAQMIVEIRAKLGPEHFHFSEVFELTREVVMNKYEEWFKPIPREHRQVLGFILGGLERDGTSKIYYLTSPLNFAPQLSTTGTALGGIPQYATYLVHRLYNPEMTTDDLVSLAAYVISETATQDPKVGGPIKIAVISPTKGYIELEPSTIQGVIEQNEETTKKLRDFFSKREKK
jgi:20S proteasome alpha/beta subunit